MDTVTMVPTATNGQHSNPDLQIAILKESLVSRRLGSNIALLGTAVSVIPFCIVLLDQVPLINLIVWMLPVLSLLIWRTLIGRWATPVLLKGDDSELRRLDKRYRFNSMVNQFWAGSGVWSVAMFGNEITP